MTMHQTHHTGSEKKVQPRNLPPVDVRFMSLAISASFLSCDPIEQFGAVITNTKEQILAVGYNRKIESIFDRDLSYDIEDKHVYMNSAEDVALDILQLMPVKDHGLKLYMTHPPCLSSMQRIANIRVLTVIYGSLIPSTYSEKEFEHVKKLAKASSVTMQKFEGNLNWIRDRLEAVSDIF